MNTSNELTASRSFWIDNYRVIAMIIIVSGHVSGWSYLTANIASLACVNFFFWISGYFSKISNFKAYVKRISYFLVPYIFYNFLTIIFLQFTNKKGSYPLGHWESWLNALIDPASFVMWFLAVLIILTVIAPILHRLPTIILVALVVLLSLIYNYLIINVSGYQELLSLQSICFGGIFFLLGLCVKRIIDIKELSLFLKNHLLYISIIIAALFITHKVLINSNSIYADTILDLLSIISVPALSIIIDKYFPRLSLQISKLTPAIFFIFASHAFITRAWGKLYITLDNKGYHIVSEILAQTGGIIIFFMCYIAFCLLQSCRYLNRITMVKS